ncbi:unnamed protein product [Cylindrotheca closterium]|uniref:Cytochrome b561 domain-containing protein n=1 Tax=Cylindrotheca closterium TaxID=2856 RepID=A0AAD2FVF3_9STRA|nr:unnamed protein product [Cylindrotheca closterium]
MEDESSTISEQAALVPQQDVHPSDHHQASSEAPLLNNNNNNNNNNAEDMAEAGLSTISTAAAAATTPPPVTTPRSLEMDEWNRTIQSLQRASLIAAHALIIVLLVLMAKWVSQLGGLPSSLRETGNAKLVFNWHPLLMILAFCFMTISSLSFRYHRYFGHYYWHQQQQQQQRTTVKLLHGIGWAVATVCMTVGLVAVFFSHNDRASGFIANLYSLHSWVGIAVLLLYLVQFLVGVGTFTPLLLSGGIFGNATISAASKAKILQIHAFFGPILYISMMLTILLGIQEKEGFIGCGYKVVDNKPDMVPFQHFSKIPAVCKQSHAVGFCILAMGLCTMFTLHQMDKPKYRQHAE